MEIGRHLEIHIGENRVNAIKNWTSPAACYLRKISAIPPYLSHIVEAVINLKIYPETLSQVLTNDRFIRHVCVVQLFAISNELTGFDIIVILPIIFNWSQILSNYNDLCFKKKITFPNFTRFAIFPFSSFFHFWVTGTRIWRH